MKLSDVPEAFYFFSK